MRSDIFRRLLSSLSVTACLGAVPHVAYGQEVAIPIALPTSEAYDLLGTQLLDGLSASPLGQSFTFEVFDTACSTEGGEEAARQIAQNSQSPIIIGFACIDALDSAQATGLLADRTLIVPVTPKTGQPPTVDTSNHARQVHIAPTPDQEAETLATHIANTWQGTAIAMIDDGTLEGRGFVDLMRQKLADRQIEPVYVTNYRPQLTNQVALVRLLQRSGATHVIVGGDRFDASVIAEAMEIVGHRFIMAGSSAFLPGSAEGTLPEGTIYTALPDFASLPSAQLAVADLEEAGIVPEGFVLWGYAIGELVQQWAESAATQFELSDGTALPSVLGNLTFADGQLETNLYRIRRVGPNESLETISQ